MPDVVVTGLPRSGLTVVSALIDGLPDAVCLNAPAWHNPQVRRIRSPVQYVKWLVGDYAWRRSQFLRGDPIPDVRAADGSPLLDSIKDIRIVKTAGGDDESVPLKREGLSHDFILGMKHHALYTALLPSLAKFDHFRIIAIVRHPLDVIASWQALNDPLAQGKLKIGPRMWPEASAISLSDIEPLDRMAQLYDAFMQRYYTHQQHIDVVRYEDVIDNPKTVGELFGLNVVPPAASQIIRRPRVLLAGGADAVRESFKKYGVFTKHYYPDI